METLGSKIRKQRQRLGLTLDELAGRSHVSKGYLSLIETGRVPNPPSDEKLRHLEQTLGFSGGELLTQAHLQRTPRDVRAMLGRLISQGHSEQGSAADAESDALSGALRELVDHAASAVERAGTHAVPVINRESADYPRDFVDLAYPPRVAEQYIGCPDVADKEAFAARVQGDSMTPKYRPGDIVIFSPALAARNGDDCFVRLANGQTMFQRIFFETDGDGRTPMLRLQPRNEKYRPAIVGCEQVAGLYRAIYRYQRVDDE